MKSQLTSSTPQSKLLPSLSDYSTFSACVGTYFVDKADFIDLRYDDNRNLDPRVPIIRRGSGYGKTVFLSTLASYFDRTNSPAQFPDSRIGHAKAPRYTDVLVIKFNFEQLAPHLPSGRTVGHG